MNRLNEMRKLKSYTIQNLADNSGVKVKALERYLTDVEKSSHKGMSTKNCALLATCLDCNMSDIVEDIETRKALLKYEKQLKKRL